METLRNRLVDDLKARDEEVSPQWEAVFRRVPRHVFVPRALGCFPPDDDGSTEFVLEATGDRERWLRLVYSNRLLLTQEDGERCSSSSAPHMMARFLEFLQVEDGDRVLEVGTGTGYNAALLCERLGSENVTSIDVDAELVELARYPLALCGYSPTLAAGDGWDGYEPYAPYDRILATCSVPRIPDAWLNQLAPGGRLVTPMYGGHFARVGLVGLDARPDGSFEGRFHPRGAVFMPLRHGAPPSDWQDVFNLAYSAQGERRSCAVPEPVATEDSHRGPEGIAFDFLVRLQAPPELHWFWFAQPGGGKAPAVANAADRSWARVTLGADGAATVAQGGPQRLWDLVERSWVDYLRLGKPHMGRYGMTITPDRRQFVWLDDPGSEHRWQL